MNAVFHLQPAAPAVPVVIGSAEFVASAFAMPVLPGWDGAMHLRTSRGELPDLHSLAKVLHERAGLGSDEQMLYVFPRLIDAAVLSRLLSPQAQRTITEAMCADALTVARGEESKLDSLIPYGEFADGPLAFVLGLVFMHPWSRHELALPRRGWRSSSAAREEAESVIGAQLAELGFSVPFGITPTAPTDLAGALIDGLVKIAREAGDLTNTLSVDLEGNDVVHVRTGAGTRISLSRACVGTPVIEALLNELEPPRRTRPTLPGHVQLH